MQALGRPGQPLTPEALTLLQTLGLSSRSSVFPPGVYGIDQTGLDGPTTAAAPPSYHQVMAQETTTNTASSAF